MDYEIMMNGNVRLGQLAPEIEADSTMGKIKLSDYNKKWIVLFSYPRRFWTYFNKWDDFYFGVEYIF